VSTETPYPRSTPDFVPYREFEQLMRRVGYIEQKQIGEAIVRLEERMHVTGDRVTRIEQSVASIDHNLEQLQKAETTRAGFRLGTKELVIMVGVVVTILGTIIAAAVAVVSLGG
jgi:tetrahydromethanopterin S-methyltransferase subunit G